ncbi:MAG: hypothetical protein PHC61_06335 [Chitinivibrionales bacterium]|nr:hypothetical protein [Chitinivibrionales bacterium]
MRYKRVLGQGILGFFLLLTFGCGPRPSNLGYSDAVPSELQNLIKQYYSEGIYAIGSATGPDEDVAVNKAGLQARAEIAREFKSQIDVLQKEYDDQVGNRASSEYSHVMEVFAQLDIGGSKVAKTLVQKNGKEYSAKVLVVVSAEQVKNIFDEKLSSFTSFKASKAYQELEKRANRERQNQGHATE